MTYTYHSRSDVATDLAVGIGADPSKDSVIDGFVAWGVAEGGGSPHAQYNMLNTTLHMPGAIAYNTIKLQSGVFIHVWNYADYASGLSALIHTLLQPNFTDVRYAFKGISNWHPENHLAMIGHAVLDSPWGTTVWPKEVTLSQRNQLI